jgi:hypothetical protein
MQGEEHAEAGQGMPRRGLERGAVGLGVARLGVASLGMEQGECSERYKGNQQ